MSKSEEIRKALDELDEAKTAGPDEVAPIILKRCRECMMEPLRPVST